MTYAPAKFKVASSNGLGGDAFTINALFDLRPCCLVTQKFAQYPLHHVTYASAKFEYAMSSGLGGYAFTRNTFLDL